LSSGLGIVQFSESKRIKYEQEMISEHDYNNILATAREEGRIEEWSVISKKVE
jgi:hypothetical protein